MTAHLHLLLGAALVLATAGIIFGLGWEARGCWAESRVSRLADPEPMPGELPAPEYTGAPPWRGAADPGFELRASYGPFPVDTGPLLLLSGQAAAIDAHEREVTAMIRAAEAKIGPVR